MRFLNSFILVGAMMMPILAANKDTERLDAADTVFKEIMGSGDKQIPQDLLEKAHCMVKISCIPASSNFSKESSQ